MESKKHRRGLRVLLLIAVILALLAAAFFIYTGIYYHADETALAALADGGTVRVAALDDGWLFDGPGTDTALIFYPGAKVEAAAYAPLLRLAAEGGVDCFLVKMPFNLAFFGMNKAAALMDAYSYDRWFLAGHSLGGAMAASFASKHLDALNGLALLAAYPTSSLQRDGFSVLSVYGSEDGVLSMDKVAAGRQYMPADHTELVLEGGNHAWFGSYGQQSGDGQAAISHDEQWSQTAAAIRTLCGVS